ncbi:MAG: SAM-dependent methyltransferase [Bacteroidetes bacterium 46-16]|nr:MAG: SAM-dependent methyltransferase [Bacteroidetes bacterium 46-16]
MAIGSLYMIPIPIADDSLQTLSAEVAHHTLHLRHYFVENLRTARRFLKALHPDIIIDDIRFSEIDKHNGADTGTLKTWLKEGHNIGVLSEAGCPGIADPGAELAAIAQNMNATVIPLTGPNSLILALMASGLNGQSFCFNGYLPVKDPARSKSIKALEQQSQKERQTQLFIETPYRNNAMLDDLLKHCQPRTRICIAQNITAANASIKTMTVADWKKNKPRLEKLPAVFLLLA